MSDEALAQLEAVARRAARLDEAKQTLDAVKARVVGLSATNVAVDVDGLVRAIEALDAHLWTYSDDGFLPHGTWRETDSAAQPVLLTLTDSNPNEATVRFLIEGAPLPADADAYARIVLVFNGDDDEAVAAARGHWSAAKAKGFEATYWQPDEQGRWVKKA